MLVYPGTSAVSDFRQKKILKQLQEIDHNITSVSAQYVHFVDTQADLTADEDAQLRELLAYGSGSISDQNGELFLVTPRPGTISPWSSKSTDIALNSGLIKVSRIERGIAYYVQSSASTDRNAVAGILHDRMTDAVLDSLDDAAILFKEDSPKQLITVPMLEGGKDVLVKANLELGTAIATEEIDYLYEGYKKLGRNPTDAELMMFGVVNSEHCRHKIFNADWVVDGEKQPKSLFKMIRNTYELGGEDVLSAYSDNSAVLRGAEGGRFFANPDTHEYTYHTEPIHSVIKVETHNHPTAIAPFPGAATGTGGEIRDEGATGRGAKPKMGLAGFSVSNLNLPGAEKPWEKYYGKPDRIQSPLNIMIEAPLGGAAFANEFGRPNLLGYFRTYEQADTDTTWGYHKPIMIAGGMGNIRDIHVEKHTMTAGAKIVVLGGPAMLIGLGGGAASSMQSGSSAENLDFASVQRANAEMQRRVQEVIDACWAMGDKNPIITIHDIGAGGYCNGLPEIVHDSDLGAEFELRDLPSAEPGMSPLEIWCNEAQERYVLGISEENLPLFEELCKRERCPFNVVGTTTDKPQLVVSDRLFKNKVVDLPMDVLFGKPPKMTRTFSESTPNLQPLSLDDVSIDEAVERVLSLPAVGSKKFLITIGDRNVGGLVARDQMIGPWQVPVSDVAVTAAVFDSNFGEAMAMGERAPIATIDSPASARMAIGETITNIISSDIEKLSDIKLSANWMAATGFEHEDEKLYKTVAAVGEDFCPALGLTIPVGKDSLSMRTIWDDGDEKKSVTSPLSVVITGFSPVVDVRKTVTPLLAQTEDTSLVLIDLGTGANRLGGSALAQVFNQIGDVSPDIEAKTLETFFTQFTKLKQDGKVLAYHDRSDGGLLATLSEMAFASRCGLDIDLSALPGMAIEKLFNEELGAVIQVKKSDIDTVLDQLDNAHVIGSLRSDQTITIKDGGSVVYENTRAQLESWWADTSYQIQKLRDNPDSAEQEYSAISDENDPGISPVVSFNPTANTYSSRPKIAIFREQGVNGQIEMAAAFDKAGFTSIDVHLNDVMNGKVDLNDFVGLVACGGFSYGDVLGAGEGWAKTILFHKELRTQFQRFFERTDTFTLGVCNGCQMLSALKELIPGAKDWPEFLKNESEQFEARVATVQINESPSIFFKGMAGSYLPIAVAHGEGRAHFADNDMASHALVAMQYTDNNHKPTEQYPLNPNGSPLGITSLTTSDGRATIMMPHPERVFMTRQLSWHPEDWGEDSPWMQIFRNARDWVGKS